jgi:hypothetical protein
MNHRRTLLRRTRDPIISSSGNLTKSLLVFFRFGCNALKVSSASSFSLMLLNRDLLSFSPDIVSCFA